MFVLFVYVFNYAGYRLSVAGDELEVTYGLLERQHVHVPRARLQHVTIVDNPLQRRLGLASMHLRSAANIGGGNTPGRVDIPLIRRAALPGLLPQLLGDPAAAPPELTRRPRAAKRRGIVRRTVLLVIPAIVALFVFPPVGIVALAVALAAGYVWGRAAHTLAGFAVRPPVASFAAGVFRHETHLVPIARVQSARTHQSPFQRRAALSTIFLDIAGSRGAPSLYDASETTAHDIRRSVPLLTATNATPSH
jgi:putative membrane protein